MKRLFYISKLSRYLSPEQIQQIREVSVRNNQRDHITGVLLFLSGLFFQILEGNNDKIDELYEKILNDDRHTDILCLKTEYHIKDRMFPDWAMNIINLDEQQDIFLQPIKSLLQTVTESHRILERYTQPSVINFIKQGTNPLMVLPKMTKKVILFSDIVGFSIFTEKLPIEQVVDLVNCYLTICSQAISLRGGEVIKFIGDSVMASFTAPNADAAIQAGLDILTQLQTLREQANDHNPAHLLHTGIGIAYGDVIEGNVGSSIKMDYTLLGDAVNVAARLESLSHTLQYALVLSNEVKSHTKINWNFISLGQQQTKGKQKLVDVYSIADPITYKSKNVTEFANLMTQTLDRITTLF